MSLVGFIHAKARAFVVFLFSLLALGILILTTLAAGICPTDGYLFLLLAGVLLMAVAIPFHWNGKKWKTGYLISFLLNSVGSGLSVSALFVAKQLREEFLTRLLAALPATGILFLVYLMLQIFHKTKKVTVTIACLLNAALTIGLMVLWIAHGYPSFSFAFFCSLVSFFYLCVFGVTVNHEERSLLRDVSFGSFGSFIILTVVVVFILSEGEILDGLDAPDLGGRKKKKK